jgi:hypothetical protein
MLFLFQNFGASGCGACSRLCFGGGECWSRRRVLSLRCLLGQASGCRGASPESLLVWDASRRFGIGRCRGVGSRFGFGSRCWDRRRGTLDLGSGSGDSRPVCRVNRYSELERLRVLYPRNCLRQLCLEDDGVSSRREERLLHTS